MPRARFLQRGGGREAQHRRPAHRLQGWDVFSVRLGQNIVRRNRCHPRTSPNYLIAVLSSCPARKPQAPPQWAQCFSLVTWRATVHPIRPCRDEVNSPAMKPTDPYLVLLRRELIRAQARLRRCERERDALRATLGSFDAAKKPAAATKGLKKRKRVRNNIY
jgi:hypothetical protein